MRARRGFTLLEVMIALALLGLALVVLIKSAAGSIFNAEEAHMMGVATDLARARMYEEEETLIKDGFSDTDTTSIEQCTGTGDDGFKPCDPELWQDVTCCVNVQQIELPSMDVLQQMVMGKAQSMAAAGSAAAAAAAAAGSGSGSAGDLAGSAWSEDQINAFKNSTLGGMLAATGILGGDGGTGVLGAQGGMFIQMFYEQITQILKVAIRKVTLTVRWKVLGHPRDMKVVAFFTDPAAMDQVLQGFGAADTSGATGVPTTGTGTGTPGSPTSGGLKLPTGGGTPTK